MWKSMLPHCTCHENKTQQRVRNRGHHWHPLPPHRSWKPVGMTLSSPCTYSPCPCTSSPPHSWSNPLLPTILYVIQVSDMALLGSSGASDMVLLGSVVEVVGSWWRGITAGGWGGVERGVKWHGSWLCWWHQELVTWRWWVALLVVLVASDMALGAASLGAGRIDELIPDWPKRGQSPGCLDRKSVV